MDIINDRTRNLIALSTPWLMGKWVIATATIAENDVVIIDNVSSGLFTVSPADASAGSTARGLLGVACSGAAATDKLVVVPWRRIDNVDTSAGALKDPVYLSDTAGGWSLTPGAVNVQIGVVVSVDASAGAILLDPNASYGLGSGGSEEASLLVRNETGGALTAGTLVYVSGYDNATSRDLIAKADANAVGTLATWVLRDAIANTSNGVAYKTYRLTGIDTSLGAEGDAYYLSETVGVGTLTLPTAGGTSAQVVGRVATVDAAGTVEIDLIGHAPFLYLGNLSLQNGILSADSNGRALIATDYFDAATVLLKIADGAFAANDSTRALFGNGIWEAKQLAQTQLVLREEFLNAVGGTLPGPWAKDMETANITGDYLADTLCGVWRILSEATSEAQSGQLTWGNQLLLNPAADLVVEFHITFAPAGATFTADERLVIGLCSDHTNAEDSLDAVTSNLWFRIEGANLDILVEKDDGTDVDDQDSTINIVKSAKTRFTIDCTTLATVVMSVDGVAQGGAAINAGGLSSSTPLQPIVCMQRDAGTEVNSLDVDLIVIYQDRA